MKKNPMRKYLRKDSLPHFFCSGCGAAQVLNYFVQAADEIGLDFDKLVAIGGVGCAARIPVYLHAEALHGVHGRTLPWATGIKLHNPQLEVVIFSGDGDAAAIGGNHLIQAARRTSSESSVTSTFVSMEVGSLKTVGCSDGSSAGCAVPFWSVSG